MARKAVIHTFMGRGYEGLCITIECSIRNGFPGFDIVGLPDSAVRESRERVKAALRSCGFKFPQQRVLVNLSPAGLQKSGGLMDLGIALAVLFASSENRPQSQGSLEQVHIMAAGELGLDGSIVTDPSAMGALQAARSCGCGLCIIPEGVCTQTRQGVFHASTLTQAFLSCGEFINGKAQPLLPLAEKQRRVTVFEDIIGMSREKEILTFASAGLHSILMFGPPGVGKTLLCSRIGLLLPDLTSEESEEVARIYGCAGIKRDDMACPVTREVAHDCSAAQFNGGKSQKSPGEGALAHKGVLLLDEITKYTPKLLESVKQAYDSGWTTSSRSGEAVRYPSRFLMAGNLNPCPCGGLGSHTEPCSCTTQKVASHWNHIGRPLASRFDIRIPVNAQDDMFGMLAETPKPDSFYKDIICNARERMAARYSSVSDIRTNGEVHLDSRALSCLSGEISLFRELGLEKAGESPRSLIAAVTLARTIADCADRDAVTEDDFMQAKELMRYGLGDYFWKVVV